MSQWFLFVLLWLGAYRVTRFALDDTLIAGLRHRWFMRFPPNADYAVIAKRPRSKWGDLLDCYWCLGFWIAGADVLIAAQLVSVPLPVAWWLALSSAVALTAGNLDGE